MTSMSRCKQWCTQTDACDIHRGGAHVASCLLGKAGAWVLHVLSQLT